VILEIDSILRTTYAGFKYLIPPTLTSVHPIAGALTGGTRVTMRGTNLGEDASTGRGAYVGATFDGMSATNCGVEAGALVCSAPAGVAPSSVSVLLDIDGATSNTLTSIFTYLEPPVVNTLAPPSGYSNDPTPIVISGSNFGPLASTGLNPSATVYIGERECSNVTVVASNGTEMITCIVPPGHGPDALIVDIDGTNSSEPFIFTDYNDAGTFTFASDVYTVQEESDTNVTITVRRSTSLHPSPTLVQVSVADGTAESPNHFIAKTVDLDFAENVFEKSFSVDITAGTRKQSHPRSGVMDDRWALLSYSTITPRHGTAVAGSEAIILIQYRCSGVGYGCSLDWGIVTSYDRDPAIEPVLPEL